MKIKICGVIRLCDIDYINEAQPDYVGFVFAKSSRKIEIAQAEKFKSLLDKNIIAVGVFVNEKIELINQIVSNNIIDVVQLHGSETNDYITQIKAPTIKAIRPNETPNVISDFLLFDNVTAGSGQTFDWNLLPKTNKPYFLAGGINIDNIDAAMSLNPFGIDMSSGVETDGFKDKNKILKIVRRIRDEKR